jgi:hypothetical protein
MKSANLAYLIASFVVALFATGISYWQIPYSKASLPSSLYNLSLAVVWIASFTLRLLSKASFAQATLMVGLAVPAMVLARVIVETSQDPTSHNLWPLELIIASAVGLTVSLVGSLAGGLLARLVKVGAADRRT